LERPSIQSEERFGTSRSSDTICPSPRLREHVINPSKNPVLTVMSFDRGMPVQRVNSDSRRFSDPIGNEKGVKAKAFANLKTLIRDLENIDMDPIQAPEE
jgi:hypothetical protein